MRFDRIFGLAIAVSASATLNAGPVTYTVVDLGTRGGVAYAAGINASGQTVSTQESVFGWSRVFSDFANLTPAGTSATGSAINSAGQVAGTVESGGNTQATVWTNGTAVTIANGSAATGINDAGQVTGANASGHAYLYNQGVMQDLGVLAGGSWSSGYGINSNGAVVGYGDTASGAFRGFLWSGSGGLQTIGTLGGTSSYAMSINDANQVTGSAATPAGFLHAYLFGTAGMSDLGTLGGTSSFGYGVNNSGTVVGYSFTADGAQHAFVYLDGVMLDLNSMLASTGFEIVAAYGINDSGQIVGTARVNGEDHAIRLDPQVVTAQFAQVEMLSLDSFDPVVATPEPGTWLAGAALGGLLLYRAALARFK